MGQRTDGTSVWNTRTRVEAHLCATPLPTNEGDTHEVRARYTSICGLPPPELLLRLEFGRWHIFQRRGNDIGNGENRETVTGRTTSARVDRDAGRQHNETLRAIRNAGNEQRVLVRDVTLPCASASSVQV